MLTTAFLEEEAEIQSGSSKQVIACGLHNWLRHSSQTLVESFRARQKIFFRSVCRDDIYVLGAGISTCGWEASILTERESG